MLRFRNLAALPLAAALAACTDTANTPVALSPDGIQISAAVISGTPSCPGGVVTANDGDVLSGQVNISPGCTFVVNPIDLDSDGQVTIFGDANTAPSALVIHQDAQIRSVGTASVPIVFTPNSTTPEPGDWGGIVLIGSGQTNDATATVEGLPGSISYGGSTDLSSIGDIVYTRIEYAGYVFAANNELNGLSMYGVGCSPSDTLAYIQVHRGSDDGFEFFGGCADLKYAVATGNEDDSFDYSYGWRGRGQFWIALQSTGAGDKGFEADNDDAGTTSSPRTNPYIVNATLVGRDTARTAGVGTNRSIPDSTVVHSGNWGIQLRLQVQSTIRNSVVMGFEAACDATGASTHDVTHSIFYAKAVNNCTNGFAGSIRSVMPGLYRPLARADTVDFRPTTAAAAAASGAYTSVPSNPSGITGVSTTFFTPTNYVGAAAPRPAGAEWYKGWTNWDF